MFEFRIFVKSGLMQQNGGKVWAPLPGALAQGKFAPHRAVNEELEMVGSYVKEAIKTGKVRENWAKDFELKVLHPLFSSELKTPEAQEKAIKTLPP